MTTGSRVPRWRRAVFSVLSSLLSFLAQWGIYIATLVPKEMAAHLNPSSEISAVRLYTVEEYALAWLRSQPEDIQQVTWDLPGAVLIDWQFHSLVQGIIDDPVVVVLSEDSRASNFLQVLAAHYQRQNQIFELWEGGSSQVDVRMLQDRLSRLRAESELSRQSPILILDSRELRVRSRTVASGWLHILKMIQSSAPNVRVIVAPDPHHWHERLHNPADPWFKSQTRVWDLEATMASRSAQAIELALERSLTLEEKLKLRDTNLAVDACREGLRR